MGRSCGPTDRPAGVTDGAGNWAAGRQWIMERPHRYGDERVNAAIRRRYPSQTTRVDDSPSWGMVTF